MRGTRRECTVPAQDGPWQFGEAATAELPARGGQRELQVVQAGSWKRLGADGHGLWPIRAAEVRSFLPPERHDLSAHGAHSFRRLEYRTRFARGQRNGATTLQINPYNRFAQARL